MVWMDWVSILCGYMEFDGVGCLMGWWVGWDGVSKVSFNFLHTL